MTTTEPNKWAKVFEIDGRQILFYCDKVLEENLYDIHQIVDHNGEKVDILLRNVPSQKIEKCFSEIDETYARTAVNIIDEIINDYDKHKNERTVSDTAL
jgi:hypothetical protein